MHDISLKVLFSVGLIIIFSSHEMNLLFMLMVLLLSCPMNDRLCLTHTESIILGPKFCIFRRSKYDFDTYKGFL